MSDLDLVEFDVSADKSSTESENEGFLLTQLAAEAASLAGSTNDCR